MRRHLVLVGAGGLGREIADLFGHAGPTHHAARHRLVGFVDDDRHLTGRHLAGFEVLGTTRWLDEHEDLDVIVSIAHPRRVRDRLNLAHRLDVDPRRFATLIHPSAAVGTEVTIGFGSVVHPHAIITTGVRIGRHVQVLPGAIVSHDNDLGDGTTVGAGVRLAGSVTTGEGAYLGAGAMVREGVHIGSGATVAMGAVVLADVPDATIVAGVPARALRTLTGAGS
jgi:sugar O-acyltransferase (sialic acid O-acetyltransferase NeuD family)